MADMERPGGNWSVLICCLFPSRAVQPILLYFETINRYEVILRIHFDSVSSKDYRKLNIGEGHHFDTGAHLKNCSWDFLELQGEKVYILKSTILNKDWFFFFFSISVDCLCCFWWLSTRLNAQLSCISFWGNFTWFVWLLIFFSLLVLLLCY